MVNKNYLERPVDESCYEYLKKCYAKISRDIGEDYTAFVTPVADVESETSMKRLFSDVEKMSSFLYSKGIKKGDIITLRQGRRFYHQGDRPAHARLRLHPRASECLPAQPRP